MSEKLNTTLATRGSKYGEIESNCIVTAGLMRIVMTGDNADQLTDVHRECLHMICHKIARMVNGDVNYIDNPHDIAGYATLLEGYLKGQHSFKQPTQGGPTDA